MPDKGLHVQQNENVDRGRLQVNVTSTLGLQPVVNARVGIAYTGESQRVLEELQTDSSGQTEAVTLDAPPVEYSQEPDRPQPFSEYTVTVQAEGYRSVEVSAIDVFANVTALQEIRMEPLDISQKEGTENIVVPPNTLWGDFPPKIPEDEVKPVNESGEIVLSRVVIPEYVIVHDGPPTDTRAQDYYVRYRDYIKNVASSEIYSTWPEATLRANILAIMSFSLNRVYTEWYRGKGYDFTITSSTAYDQKWSFGRTIFSNISRIVDEIFNHYLSRPNVQQPILTQYCDGKNVRCPKWLSQWGSKDLADQGLRTIEILRYYYGSNIYISTAEEISGIPTSWAGELSVGSEGKKVSQLQEHLNVIAGDYPAIPRVAVDGIYGPLTAEAVRIFQSIFGLPATGVVDYRTWYKISQIYVGVTGIAEL